MKILVANEKEKELVQRFIKCLHETCSFDDICNNDHSGSEEDIFLNSDEHKLMQENLTVLSVQVDESVHELSFEDDTCITGKCKECSAVTEGTTNGDPITYSEYLKSRTEEQQNNWLCETCYNKLQSDISL